MISADSNNAASQTASGRKRAADLLARAERSELSAAWNALPQKPAAHPVRGPETGLVMVRGRIGGGGAPSILAR